MPFSRLRLMPGHSIRFDAIGTNWQIDSSEPIRVGLEHPFDPTKAIGVVSLDNEAICASVSNRRRWGEGVHHILDGRTGKPVADVIATWAVASSALVADGLVMALFCFPRRAERSIRFFVGSTVS